MGRLAVNGKIELAWGDGDHVFNIAKLGLVLELEEKCGCGVYEVFTRIRENRWRLHDIRETVRLALIGGGKTPAEALGLVKRYVDERPWQENIHVALAVLMAAIVGVPGDDVGKEQAERAATGATMDASSAPQSTAHAPPSAGPQGKPTNAHFGKSPPLSTAGTKPTARKKSPRGQPARNLPT